MHIDKVYDQIEVFDLSGRQVFQSNEMTKQIDLAYLTEGLYLIRLQTEEGIYQNSFVKQK